MVINAFREPVKRLPTLRHLAAKAAPGCDSETLKRSAVPRLTARAQAKAVCSES